MGCCELERVKKRTEHFRDWPIHGWLDLWQSDTWCLRIFWILIVAFAFCLSVYMCNEIVKNAQESPTSSKIDNLPLKDISYPVLTICDYTGEYFLDKTKLDKDNVSALAVKAALLLGPVWTLPVDQIPPPNVFDDPNVQALMTRLKSQFGANPVDQLEGFYARYGVACQDLFHSCRRSTFAPLETCCDMFKPVAHVQHGLCFASDLSSSVWPIVRAPQLFSNVFIEFNHPNIWHAPELLNASSSLPNRALEITVYDGIAQDIWRADSLVLHYGDWMTLKLSAQHIIVQDGTNPCVTDPQLDYFKDYSFANCMWEKRFLQNPNFTKPGDCRLPITVLAKRGFLNSTVGIKQTPLPANQTRFCTPEEIYKKIYPFKFDAKLMEHANIKNTSKYGGVTYWMDKLQMDADNPCNEPCDQWLYGFTHMTESEYPEKDHAGLTLTFADPQYVQIQEVVTLQWTDYLALIGGIWGLWMGASVLTVVQFIVYVFRAICRVRHVTVKPKKSFNLEKPKNGQTNNFYTVSHIS